MRRKRKNRKGNNKKYLSLICIFVILTITIGIIYIPRIYAKAEDSSISERIIKLLEIEPGDKFVFKSNEMNYNNIKVKITQVDMPTYISMVDEIEGKYDVVYIGRDNSGLDNKWNRGTVYRDYTAPLDQEWGTLGNNNMDSTDGWRSQMLWYGYGGESTYNNINFDVYGQLCSGLLNNSLPNKVPHHFNSNFNGYDKTMLEYYSENDITNKRAAEIIKMINKGQLVLMDENILNDENLKVSKLFKNFNQYKDSKDNFKKVNHNIDKNELIKMVVDSYEDISKESLQPSLVWEDKEPNGKITDRNIKFSFKVLGTSSKANYKVRLFLDYDGDGLFDNTDGHTLDNNVIADGKTVNTVSYKLDDGIVGFLQWKFEIIDLNSGYKDEDGTDKEEDYEKSINKHEDCYTKTYKTGSVILASNGNKININVLQLKPDKCLYDMSSKDFEGYYNYSELSDYNITIKSMTISEFNKNCVASNYYEDIISKKYNMVVLGFADNYGNGVSNQFDDNSIKVLKKCYENNMSMLFTHDSMNLDILNEVTTYDTSNKQKSRLDSAALANKGPKKLSQAFRDIVGQARYTDPFVNMSDWSENDKVNYNKIHDDLYNYNEDGIKIPDNMATLGITAYSNLLLYTDTNTNHIKNINESQLSSYPYDLSNKTIKVSDTHTQWYQLDLEDPDIVPVYNLEQTNDEKKHVINSGDSRNFYSTYTKGNITYSGLGHAAMGTDEEKQLFVNTIIKAYKGGNKIPVVTFSTDDSNVVGNGKTKIIDGESSICDGNKVDLSGKTITIDLASLNKKPFKFDTDIMDDSYSGDNMKVTLQYDNANYIINNREYTITDSSEGIQIKNSAIDYSYLLSKVGETICVSASGTDKGNLTGTQFFKIYIINSVVDAYHGIDKNEEAEFSNDYEDNFIDKDFKFKSWAFDTETNNYIDAECSLRGYYQVIPFVAYFKMVNSDRTVSLSLDREFSSNPDGAAENRAYTSPPATVPKVYVEVNGELIELGNMITSDNGKTYSYNLKSSDVFNATGSYGMCNYVIKYYAKTYNHSINDNNSILVYSNRISISNINSDDINVWAQVEVDYKKLHGNLF